MATSKSREVLGYFIKIYVKQKFEEKRKKSFNNYKIFFSFISYLAKPTDRLTKINIE